MRYLKPMFEQIDSSIKILEDIIFKKYHWNNDFNPMRFNKLFIICYDTITYSVTCISYLQSMF